MKKMTNKKKLPHADKYKNSFFVKKYVALWAYGYKIGLGYSEGLYRSVNELGFSCLAKNSKHKILEVGCGTGRTIADFAKFFRNAEVLGIDSAKLMIDMACRINKSNEIITLDMRKLGFGRIKLKGEIIKNAQFRNVELENFCSNKQKKKYNLVIAVNFFDRVVEVKQSVEMIFTLLKKGGFFILATPLNFSNQRNWNDYGSFKFFQNLIKDVGFSIDVAFDGLIYQEILDTRGAIEEYPTILMRLIK